MKQEQSESSQVMIKNQSSKASKQHSSSLNESQKGKDLVILQRADLNGSGNLKDSLKVSQQKSSTKSSVTR